MRSAGKTRLLVDGEQELQRTVGDVVVLHYRQGRGHTDAVVGTQRGAVRLEPVAIANHANGVAIEVMGCALVLLADHIQVTL